MPPEPLLSVVIPAFDAELHLAEAIESVLRQGERDLEILVVDDGSTDGTAGVARSFGSPVRVISQESHGAGHARNAGVREARGEYVAFLDHDDVWEADKLEHQLAALAADPGLDLVFGHMRQFRSPEIPAPVAARIHCPPEPQAALLPGTLLVRLETFRRVGEFGESSQASEFLEWLLRADDLGLRRLTIPQTVLWRRLHATNFHVLNPRARSDYVRTLKVALDRRRAGGVA